MVLKLIACHEGNIFVSSTLLLTNVFYVPKLKCDLISISQLQNKHPSYYVGIANGNIVIHDRTTSAKIGTGRLHDGVYYFSQVQVCHVSISSFDLLHKLLEHTYSSSSNMNKLKDVFFYSSNAFDYLHLLSASYANPC